MAENRRTYRIGNRGQLLQIDDEIFELCDLLGIKRAKGDHKKWTLPPDALLFKAIEEAMSAGNEPLHHSHPHWVRGMTLVSSLVDDISSGILRGCRVNHTVDDALNRRFSPEDPDDDVEASALYFAYELASAAFWKTVEREKSRLAG